MEAFFRARPAVGVVGSRVAVRGDADGAVEARGAVGGAVFEVCGGGGVGESFCRLTIPADLGAAAPTLKLGAREAGGDAEAFEAGVDGGAG